MKLFLAYLRLIRPFNLIMIAFTMDMVRYFFLKPINRFSDYSFVVSENTFMLFTLSFLLVAAAGYIINDYYDVEIDKINKPDKVIVGNTVSPLIALCSFWILSIIGIVIGFWASTNAGVPFLGTLFIFYAVGLWAYSFKLKSTFLAGNLIIALFLGLVPLAASYIELQADLKSPDFITHYTSILPYRTGTWVIAGFAFLSSLIREVVKDMEDTEGDKIAGCRTMPIVLGIKKVKIFVYLLLFVMLALLGFLQYWGWVAHYHMSVFYVFIFVEIPFIIVVWKLGKATGSKNFHNISTWLKIIMVTGICCLFVFAYESNIALELIRTDY